MLTCVHWRRRGDCALVCTPREGVVSAALDQLVLLSMLPGYPWVIGADDLAKYQLIFDHHNSEGYVSGPNAAALFNKSGLAREVGYRLIAVCVLPLVVLLPFGLSLVPLLCGTTAWVAIERTQARDVHPVCCWQLVAETADAFSQILKQVWIIRTWTATVGLTFKSSVLPCTWWYVSRVSLRARDRNLCLLWCSLRCLV